MMTADIALRWVDGPTASEEDWDRIELIMMSQHWMSLNRPCSRVRVAELDGKIVGLCVFQLIPHLEPLWVAPEARGSGLAESLADDCVNFLNELDARGWITIADNTFAERLCQREGMREHAGKVYMMIRGVTDVRPD